MNLESLYEESSNTAGLPVEFKESIYWRNQFKRIKKYINKDIKSILDVGCRSGDFLMHIPSNIVREGIELSQNSKKIATERGVFVHHDYIENINFQKKYDVVTCYAILEHLEKPLPTIDKLASIINADGGMVILIPTHQCFKCYRLDKFTSKQWHMYCPPEHLNLFSKEFLDNYLSEKGLRLTHRYWTSGGMFNPFRGIPILEHVCYLGMTLFDEYLPTNRLPIFDHLYSYYKKA